MNDVIVIGGGHNGLVAAAFLAKAGLKTVVLERSDRVGGGARTSDVAPGFRSSTLAHAAAIDPAIVRALALDRHGLQIIRPEAAVCAIGGARPLVLWQDVAQASREVAAHSANDAARYRSFLETFERISRVVRTILATAPPAIDDPSAGDLIELLKAGRAFRGLGRADGYRLLRWGPMSVADFAAEWFESEPLRATVAGGGILGSFLGPWSAGSTAVLLLLGATEAHPFATGWFARNGIGAVADALAAAARAAGAEIRTGVDVVRVDVNGDEAATGVTLASGESLTARAVVSNLDPKRTLLGLIDPAHLDPEMVRRLQHIRSHGTLAAINYAVSALPRFPGVDPAAMTGRIRLTRDVAAIERAFDAAKYGRFSDEPWIELTIPSLTDPALVPPDRHVVSAYVQYAPYHLRGTTWDAERERLAETATAVVERYAPGFTSSIVAREIATPLDFERSLGMTGGHIFHGELALDQLFITRPLLGWSRYATPIRHLYLCGGGTHPGNGLSGRSGALAAKEVVRALRNVER
jgi:phytoene dehydrogenase-like protein